LKRLPQILAQKSFLKIAINEGFDATAGNVDKYLEWYYSLGSEYMRLGKLLTGRFDEYLAEKLEENLSAGNPFDGYDQTLAAEIADSAAAKEKFRTVADRIMAENRLNGGPPRYAVITRETGMDELLALPSHNDLIGFNKRMGGGAIAAAGVISALVARKVVAKTVAKGTFKLGAKAVSKGLAKKVLAGGAGGAVVGSAVPGAGTLLGAAGGVLLGLMVGTGVDTAMFKIEEVFGRERHRGEILESLEAVRSEVLASLPGADLEPAMESRRSEHPDMKNECDTLLKEG
jgi:hypothetical protein